MLLIITFILSFTAAATTQISLEFKNYNAINYKRNFYNKFNSVSYSNKSSAGVIRIDGKEFKAKIKTNGELPKHWYNDLKSYTVTLKDSLYKKMSSFNLIMPADKSFFVEAFALKIAKENGLVVPYFEFVNLCISKRCELYLLKEDLSKNFIESRLLRGSSFFKPNIGFRKLINKHPTIYTNAYQSSFSTQNPALYNPLFYKAIGPEKNEFLFEHFLKNGTRLNKSHYKIWFYIQKFFGSFHASEMDNKVWFFNIKSFQFEPILHDVLLSNYNYSISESVSYLGKYDYLLKKLDFSDQKIPKQIFASMKALDPLAWKQTYQSNLSQEQRSQVDELTLIWKKNLQKIGKELKAENSQ